MNTNEIGSMLLLIVALLATAKKTKFGQMTLRATKALEYLKTTPEPVRRKVTAIHWLHKLIAENEDWEMPDWVMKSERYNWVAILFVEDGLPLLVYQTSALRAFEAHLMKLESNGAVVKSSNKGQKLVVDLGDETLDVGLWRNPNGGKFAPFNVDFE